VQLDSVESVDDGANSCIVASFNLDTTTPNIGHGIPDMLLTSDIMPTAPVA